MGDAPPFRYLTRDQFDRLSFDEQFDYLRETVVELGRTRARLRAETKRILSDAEDATEHT